MAVDKVDEVEDPDDNMPDDDKDLQDAEELRDPPAYVAPSADEWTRTTEALKKANNQARKLRQEKRAATKDAVSNVVTGVTGAAVDNAAAIAKAVAEATSAESKKWAPRIVASAAKAALVAAGLTGAPDRMLKMIDHEDLDIDDDGEVSGLDEQIAELKTDYPELFTAKFTKKGTRIDGSRRTAAGDGKRKSSADVIAERYGASA